MSTRDELIDAAVAHLDRHGLEGLTLRSIARAAGVSHAAPARHFDGVAALLSAVAARSFRGLSDAIDGRLADAGDSPLDRLASAGEAYVDFALAHPAEYELMFRPERLDRTDDDYLAASLDAFGRLARLVADAQAAGWRAEVDHMHLTGIVWSSVHGVVSLWIQGSLQTATGAAEPGPFVQGMIRSLIAAEPSPS